MEFDSSDETPSVWPKSLKILICEGKQLKILRGNLPDTVEEMYVSNNELNELPTLPPQLKKLVCFGNKLTSLPPCPILWKY
jgi:Leucine-rich repeat (LRR) protein